MTTDQVLQLFHETEALLEGHFQLTSGLHSSQYFQCAKVLQYPQYAEQLCSVAQQHFAQQGIAVVIAPAVGGIIVAHEVGRLIQARVLFAERQENKMSLRRGFQISPGEKVLVCEDVVTTGGSVREVIDLAREAGGEVVGVFCIVDRSHGQASFGVPLISTLQLAPKVYMPESCPLCAVGGIAEKPGSRHLKR
ncbi:MAG: orotate phosphoribosyltransferase [candidate division KSB1 bacterium]|nr:orotate phosphoribosyltransferase [candidate division KSB1 bacterium]MDZ7304950.1 orotate phosphoribosyltransferase [candidate division KSB1 bacterium]MDZ7314017.1 orotate phosphoribosyltransferase [candidate division KSB1 bacterium]